MSLKYTYTLQSVYISRELFSTCKRKSEPQLAQVNMWHEKAKSTWRRKANENPYKLVRMERLLLTFSISVS